MPFKDNTYQGKCLYLDSSSKHRWIAPDLSETPPKCNVEFMDYVEFAFENERYLYGSCAPKDTQGCPATDVPDDYRKKPVAVQDPKNSSQKHCQLPCYDYYNCKHGEETSFWECKPVKIGESETSFCLYPTYIPNPDYKYWIWIQWWFYVILVLVLALIAFIAFMLIKKFRKKAQNSDQSENLKEESTDADYQRI